MTALLRACAGFALSLVWIASTSALAAPVQSGSVTLQVKSELSRFERFYHDASRPGVTEATRWSLWRKEYGIAAVPPTPSGMALARKQLDAVWPRYKALEARLPVLVARAERDGHLAASRLARQLVPAGKHVTIRLVLYVGQFDDNAFSVPAGKTRPPETLMPVESRNIQLLLAHELSHDVNFALAKVQNSFGSPLGETIFLEGLAMRSAAHAFPGHPDSAYTEMPGDHGWLTRCLAKKDAVLEGVRSRLDDSGNAVTTQFTFGSGTTGMHREAYCAAWIIFGTLLKRNTLERLANVPENQMIPVVRKGLDESLP